MFFLFHVVFQIGGDNLASVSRSPLDDDLVGFVQVARGGGIDGFVYRGLVNDFRDAFFYAFEGGGTLAVHFHAYGGEIGWVRRECLVLYVVLMMNIVRTTGMRGFTVSALRGKTFLHPRCAVVVVFGAGR